MKIKRALVSVSDKTGIVEFGKRLAAAGVEIISTGGTMKALKEAGVPVTYVSDVTGFPEIMDGRVKTLNPYIHGGILAVRDNLRHKEEMKLHNIKPIDLVVVNLYPFQETIAKPNVTRYDSRGSEKFSFCNRCHQSRKIRRSRVFNRKGRLRQRYASYGACKGRF